ncbi:hypothetical protein ACFV2X_55560 [Streptomyces sp. NPDC059679]|uniref:hypothetical protein n=1 Tax=Streptomyces sp. NPDC059679 TaxID=3346903 RepID=UPI0036B072A6
MRPWSPPTGGRRCFARAILATTTATPDEAAETDEAERAVEEAAHAAYQEARAEMIEAAQQREQGQPLSAATEVTAPTRG